MVRKSSRSESRIARARPQTDGYPDLMYAGESVMARKSRSSRTIHSDRTAWPSR